MPWLDKHTFPRLARSTLNELQQKQHEKASLVCVRIQSLFGLALVPCSLSTVDRSGQLRCWITQTSLVQNNTYVLIFYFWHPINRYARTTRYEEAFLPKGKKRPQLLRSLGLALLLVIGGNEARNQYLQWRTCDASRISVRVFFRRSSEQESRNDSCSSSSTSWSHDVHVLSHIRTRYFSEGSVQQHPPPC